MNANRLLRSLLPCLLCLPWVAHAGPRSSTNYSITTDTTNTGGKRATSVSYTNFGSAGGVVGVSIVAAPAQTVKHGFSGQLIDPVALQLAASPTTTVDEGGTRQLSASLLYEDLTTTMPEVPATDIAWRVQGWPITGVSSTGLATAGTVSQDTGATVTAFYPTPSGTYSGALLLSVLNVSGADPNDVTKPTVTVSTPTNNAIFAEADPVVAVNGTAADNQGLNLVEMSVDGAAFTPIGLNLAPDNKTGTFTGSVTLTTGGTHTIAVRSVDNRGNRSAVVTRTVTYLVVRPLTVLINDGTRGSVTAGFVPASDRNVGVRYTITATPKPGFVFSGWTLNDLTGTGVTPLATELPTLSFVMQPTLSTLTANFISNPFTVVPVNVIGTFNGLVVPLSPPTTRVDTVGMFQNVKVLPNGTFTGRLRLDGLSAPVAGTFNTVGEARFKAGKVRTTELTILRSAKPSLIVALNLDMTGVNGITGTVKQRSRNDDVITCEISALRAIYSKTNKVPSALAGNVSMRYTLALPSITQIPAVNARFYPQGTGYATLTLTATGTISYVGKLADHTPFAGSAALVSNNRWPVFVPLYASKGLLACWGQVSEADASNYDLTPASDVVWVRPVQATKQWYGDGWPDGLLLGFEGARYIIPPATPAMSVFPSLQAITPNVTLSFTGGLLGTTLSFDQNISPTNVVTNLPISLLSPTMKITKNTGFVTGNLPHTDGTKPTYQGVILQKGTLKGAAGYFMSRSTPLDGLGESGAMRSVAK